MQVVLTQKAKDTFDEIIIYYLTEHTQDRAEKVSQSIYDAFDKIARSPMAYPVCFAVEKPQKNVRQIVVHKTFRIIYKIKTDQIDIIEIFHGSRSEAYLKDIH